jgi:hypothetical protein
MSKYLIYGGGEIWAMSFTFWIEIGNVYHSDGLLWLTKRQYLPGSSKMTALTHWRR